MLYDTLLVQDDFVLVPSPSLPCTHPSPTQILNSTRHSLRRPNKQARELSWLLTSLRATLAQLKHGLEDCAALLSPSDGAGSTLALTTPRNETVKGHTTRVGTRLVRGLVHLKLRTLPPQTLALDPARPVRIPALARLDTLLVRSVSLCAGLEDHERRERGPSAPYLAAQLRVLAQHISDAMALVKGTSTSALTSTSASTSAPTSTPTPTPTSLSASTSASANSTLNRPPSRTRNAQSQPQKPQQQHPPPTDTAWTTDSVSLGHFAPPLSRNLSLYIAVQDACLVLYVRALEPADAPVNLGTKLALAIGTTRRLEHDEADRVFVYRGDGESYVEGEHGVGVSFGSDFDPNVGVRAGSGSGLGAVGRGGGNGSGNGGGNGNGNGGNGGNREDRDKKEVEVYVREKVRVESPDPSLLSLSSKLRALGNTLGLARRNLAVVMGEEVED
ncbi:RAVE subunit 2/Rogdi [Hypoxylon sp. NC1633]|nr:RAVE subunit 2/Rogdi [Hypoxylon sp. NC1633]